MGEAMRNNKNRAGFTILEVIVVVAVIVVLTSIVVSVATRIDSQSKERLTENTFGLLNAALEQYKDFGYQYKDTYYDGLIFPLDCNNFQFSDPPNFDIQTTLINALGAANVIIDYPLAHDLNYSGSEVLYFFLSRVPANKEILNRIGKKLITNIGKGGQAMDITITTGIVPNDRTYPLYRFVDAWGTTLRYDYYDEWEKIIATRNEGKRSFPLIISAGPDKVFDTADDIKN
jgi:prepilin-type N-terminal cleavage/methylation domain-containing protein